MAAKDSGDSQLVVDESQTCSGRKQGGWITFPFVAGSTLGIAVAVSGVLSNLIVYLIKQYNVESIDAAQISNIINGCTSIAPLVGAIISDSFFGCFSVVAASTFFSLLGMILFTLTATISSLRPTPCTSGAITCQAPSTGQYGVLYAAAALMSIGTGGSRFNMATMGANQFNETREQDSFFNWFFMVLYAASVIGATGTVYIQDNVSWGWGFGLCTIANAFGGIIFVAGTRYYRRANTQGSPYMDLARVVVAAIRKRKVVVSGEALISYHYGPAGDLVKLPKQDLTQSFRCLNRAAMKTQGDTLSDGSIAKPWKLCTVQQVEDLKTIVRILPLWSTSIFLSISIGIQGSLTVLQALTVDRRLGRHFSFPAGSIIVSTLATVALALPVLDRAAYPVWHKLTGHTPTPLQRIGLGHVLNTVSMAASALVEHRRLGILRSHHMVQNPGFVVPMSVLWLLLPMMITGLAEALHFPGQVALYYQEFPESLRSTATGMIALIVALGFYLSTAVIDLVRRVTDWLPDSINASRLDRVYWMLAGIGVLNFGCYAVCARLYKYQSTRKKGSHENSGDIN